MIAADRLEQIESTPETPEEHQLYRENFYAFFRRAWDELEPSNDLHENWLQEMICEYLMAVLQGQINKLLINCPPRHLKSRIVSVGFPCWGWLHVPQTRFLCLSYAASLAIDLNYDRRRLIQSNWYQDLSHGLKLSFAKNRLSEFGNSHQGAMIARGFDGAVTGVGGDIIICIPYSGKVLTDSGFLEIGKIVEQQLPVSVATFNHYTQKIEYQSILAYEANPGRSLVEIDLGDRVLKCTEDHPVWVEGKGYCKAIDIQPGDVVLTVD